MSDVVGDWIAGFERLDPTREPRIPGLEGWARAGWPKIYRNTLRFLRERGDEALNAGFGCLELLGVHYAAGAMRVDSTGILIQYRPVTVVTIAPKLVTLSNGLVHRGHFNAAESTPIWEFRHDAKAAGRR